MFYFAYGSNMNWTQMQRRCPSSRFVCAARLPGYRFAIGRHSRLRDCGTATILQKINSEVWGVVYDVSETDLLAMDRFEDGYGRNELCVYSMNGNQASLVVMVYVAPEEAEVPLPTLEYKLLMLEGARHWRLPDAYCRMLEQIEAAQPQSST